MSRKYIYLLMKKMSMDIFEVVLNHANVKIDEESYKPVNEPEKYDLKLSVSLEIKVEIVFEKFHQLIGLTN